MTCRHGPGDINCSSSPYQVERREREAHAKEIAELKARIPATPDSKNYEIVDVEQVGPHLVLKVKYPNCAKCSYEGQKIMVFLHTTTVDALRWNTIDPHFRDPVVTRPPRHAPGPAARFPASTDGWCDALAYARGKGSAPSTPKDKP